MNSTEQLIDDLNYVRHILKDEGYENHSEPMRVLNRAINFIRIADIQLYYTPKLLEDFWQQQSDACPLEATEQENQINKFKAFTKKKLYLDDRQEK